MPGPTHRIRQQHLDIEMADEAAALALQPRLTGINRDRFLPVIERVLDEFTVPGLRIRLDKIEVDLGNLPLEGFEEEAERRLAGALRDALAQAVRDPSPGAAEADVHTELDDLEYFLLHGALPFGTPVEDFTAEAAVLTLIESDPAALAQMLRRQGRHTWVIERLVRQVSGAALTRLLEMLEPEQAALILAYMIDLRTDYRTDPPLTMPQTAFSELLWVLALSYVLSDAGTQFNRKAFVRELLEGVSESERIAYADLVRALAQSLPVTAKRHSLASSLPAVITELLDELPPDEDRQDSRAAGTDADRASEDPKTAAGHRATIANWLAEPSAAAGAIAPDTLADAVLSLARSDPTALAQILNRQDDLRETFTRLAAVLDDSALEHLLRAIGGTRAQPILALRVAIRRWRSLPPLRAADEASFERQLWTAALAEATRSQAFDRKRVLRILMEDLARTMSLTPQALLRRLQDSAASNPPPLLDLAAELFGVAAPPAADPQDWLRRYLESGEIAAAWPQHGESARDANTLLRLAIDDDPQAAATLLRALAESGRTTALAQRLLDGLATADIAALLGGRRASEIQAALRHLHDTAATIEASRALAAAVAYLLETPSNAIDATAMTQRARIAGLTADDDASAAGPLAGSTSRDGIPRADFRGFDLAEAARYVLRFGFLPWSTMLRDTATSDAGVLAGIVTLPPAQLRALLTDDDGDPPRFMIARAAQALSEETLLAVTLRLFAHAPEEAAKVRAFLLREGGDSNARRRFYARALAEALSGNAIYAPGGTTLLDTPGLEAGGAGDAAAAHVLKSRLVALLRSPDTTETANQKAAALLDALSAYGMDALEFLHAIAEQPALRAALRRRIPAAALGRTLAQLPRAPSLSLLQAEFASDAPLDKQPDTPAPQPAILRDAILAYLNGEPLLPLASGATTTGGALTPDGLAHGLLNLIATAPEEVAQALRAASPARRALWIRELPDAALARLSHLLDPVRYRALLGAAQTLAAAWRATHPGQAPHAERDLLWNVMFDFLDGAAVDDRSIAALTAAFIGRVQDTEGPAHTAFLDAANRMALAGGQGALVSALAARQQAKAAAGRAPPPRPLPPKPSPRADEPRRGEPIYVRNAGLVLTAPFLPHLFNASKLTARNAKGRLELRDREAISRAVHLLQYLVDGRCDTPEALLVLNKILCGQAPQIPVARAIEMTDEERELCDSLLKAVIQNWTAIANTSIAGLRETFLQREGKLERADDGWKLTVQRKTLDVLVDQVPWTVSMISLGWMPDILHVTW